MIVKLILGLLNMSDIYNDIANLQRKVNILEKQMDNNDVCIRLDKIIELLEKGTLFNNVEYKMVVDEGSSSKSTSYVKQIDIIDKEYIPDINISGNSSSISKSTTSKKSSAGINDALDALNNLNK